MRRRENCINCTVDMRMQERSYMNHIMTLRHTKSSIETTQPETPLRFILQQESWEKSREENIERHNLYKSRTQFSKSFQESNNKSVSFPGISARSITSSQTPSRPNSSYSSSKIHNKSSSNNYHISDSQVFLTQSNINPKAVKYNKTKIDVLLSNTPPNQWKQPQISNMNENINNDYQNNQIEPKRKKIERSPYRPAANKVLKMQKIVSNQFNKRYRRTQIALKQNTNMSSGINYETDSECVANITDDNIISENSILKSTSYISHAASNNNKKNIIKKSSTKINYSEDGAIDKENDESNGIEETQSETNDDKQDSTIINDKMKSFKNSNSDEKLMNEKDNSDNEIKRKRKKIIRKKVRKIKVIHQPQSEDLHEINFSDD